MKKNNILILISIFYISCNKYSGDYTDSFNVSSMSLNSDGSFETASCVGKWEEVTGGVKVYDVKNNGIKNCDCDTYNGFYEYYINSFNNRPSLSHNIPGYNVPVSWIKE